MKGQWEQRGRHNISVSQGAMAPPGLYPGLAAAVTDGIWDEL